MSWWPRHILYVSFLLLLSHNKFSKAEEAHHDHRFGSEQDVRDTQHIKKHLETEIEVDEQKLKEDEAKQRFLFFQTADIDHNFKVDGLEIIKSVFHAHDDEGETFKYPEMDELKLEELVDDAMRQFDRDNDGFIGWDEFNAGYHKGVP